ncbi:SRR1-like protein [Drosophila guanche]|uniref:Blast:SRR1-like protein n=1 Tax=Drosophila guanche TaxID=7266 RepID=A0A3B0JMH7_DROGU|nr:SRR1-like protein [Drosophila guanche]SPP83457.1 blast:SRR1-like protein [Drosophila guanche]
MSASGEDFQVVTRKKWIARKCLGRRDRHKSETDYLNDCPDVNVDKFKDRLERLCTKMSLSDYFMLAMETLQQQLDVLNRPLERIVCLGLGPFSRTHIALHQAAFVVSLQRHYQLKEALYFDPVFRESEKELLRLFDGSVIAEDCAGKHEATVPTIYYLPHCPYPLMHNILWRNWTRDTLPNVLLISNSFEMLTMAKKTPKDHINQILEHCTEIPLEDDYEHHNVFNDLSLHTFPWNSLPESDDETFWTRYAPLKVNEDELTIETEAKTEH